MNRLESCRKYERECYHFLKDLFEEVHWKSFEDYMAPFDFLCYNNGMVFHVDAKRIYNNGINLSTTQLRCALFVIKEKGKFILCSLRTLNKRLGYSIYLRDGKEKSRRLELDEIKIEKASDSSTNSLFLSDQELAGAGDDIKEEEE